MKKFVFSVSLIVSLSAQAQTLFTYGNKPVSKQDFLAAFNKNPSQNTDRKKALEEYKDLYVNFKLKVQSAIDNKLNEQPSFIQESTNFKRQIAESVINEEADAKALLNEAFERSQKDIDLSQIFIASNGDSAAARVEIYKAYAELKSGKNFDEVLNKYCNDESIKKAKGNIGFITVFTLPYQIENIVYALKQGTYSLPYKSAYGYHIFKNVFDRPAVGKRRVAQVLLAYPPNATLEEKHKVDSIANIVHKRAKKGENFGMLAAEYSNDYSTANNKGDMGEIGLGKFDKEFEEKIFALKNIDEISEQIHTKFGVHIIKLLEVNAVAKNLDDVNYAATLKAKLDNSDRLAIAKKNLLNKWKTLTGFKKAFYNQSSVWGFVDSVIMDKPTESFIGVAGDSTILFSFKKQNIKVADFIEYVKSVRFSETENGLKPYEELIKIFEDQSTVDYYKNHIDEYNKNTHQQLKEFDEANLLFAAMDKNVWSKATLDSAGLKEYYKQNATKYSWKPGITAITVSANSLTLATELYDKIVANPNDWKSIVVAEGAKATSDSGRFEFDQLPIKTPIEKKIGFISKPEKMGSDETFSFIYITGIFNNVEQRSFDDARGLVMNDYQQVLEQKWLADLKRKYPVSFKEEVWQTIK